MIDIMYLSNVVLVVVFLANGQMRSDKIDISISVGGISEQIRIFDG
jgi:hypothetical protein